MCFLKRIRHWKHLVCFQKLSEKRMKHRLTEDTWETECIAPLKNKPWDVPNITQKESFRRKIPLWHRLCHTGFFYQTFAVQFLVLCSGVHLLFGIWEFNKIMNLKPCNYIHFVDAAAPSSCIDGWGHSEESVRISSVELSAMILMLLFCSAPVKPHWYIFYSSAAAHGWDHFCCRVVGVEDKK